MSSYTFNGYLIALKSSYRENCSRRRSQRRSVLRPVDQRPRFVRSREALDHCRRHHTVNSSRPRCPKPCRGGSRGDGHGRCAIAFCWFVDREFREFNIGGDLADHNPDHRVVEAAADFEEHDGAVQRLRGIRVSRRGGEGRRRGSVPDRAARRRSGPSVRRDHGAGVVRR